MAHGNKSHRAFASGDQAAFRIPLPTYQLLAPARRTDWQNEAPTRGKLRAEHRGRLERSAGTENAVEMTSLRPRLEPIALHEVDICNSNALKGFPGDGGQLALEFQGAHLPGEMAQHCALVTAARPDFENPFGASQLEQFAHARHDEGLGDGLVPPNRKWIVLIGTSSEAFRDKLMPGNVSHRGEDALIPDATSHQLVANHALTGLQKALTLSSSKNQGAIVTRDGETGQRKPQRLEKGDDTRYSPRNPVSGLVASARSLWRGIPA